MNQKELDKKERLLKEAIEQLPITEKELTKYIQETKRLINKLEIEFINNGLGESIGSSMFDLAIEVNSKLNLRFKSLKGKEYINQLKREIEVLKCQ